MPAALALTTHPLVAGALFLGFSCHAVVRGSLLVSLRQQLTPSRLRGWVESAYRMIEYGTAAPGALLGGLLAESLGLTAPFWLGAAGTLLLPRVWSTFAPAVIVAARRDAGLPGA